MRIIPPCSAVNGNIEAIGGLNSPDCDYKKRNYNEKEYHNAHLCFNCILRRGISAACKRDFSKPHSGLKHIRCRRCVGAVLGGWADHNKRLPEPHIGATSASQGGALQSRRTSPMAHSAKQRP